MGLKVSLDLVYRRMYRHDYACSLSATLKYIFWDFKQIRMILLMQDISKELMK
jgi:hypothetical protein